MGQLREFIGSVLAKRQAHKVKLESVQLVLRELATQVEHIRRLATEASHSDDAPPQLRRRAEALLAGTASLDSRVGEADAKMTNLMARFCKNTINVGVAGKTGMGKSTFLQAISGLDDRVIPTSAGEPCTGAKSKVVHDEGEPHARIEYFKESEFLRGVVHSYYTELNLLPPHTLTEFGGPLPSKPEGLTPGLHAVYDKLEKLHRLLPRYRDLLSRSPERISLEDIRPYVSQDDGRYFAVRCATIHTRFPHGDVSGLGLIDLPGLGEVAKGHGEKLIQSLEQDVDAVVVIKRPLPGRAVYDTEDYKVFDLVKKTVPELELADWLFLILNRDMHNCHQVEILKNAPPKIGAQPRLIEADCRDRAEVRDRVFMQILTHFEQNLDRIDQRQLASLAEQLGELAKDLTEVVQPLADYFRTDTAGTGDYQKFEDLFRGFCQQLRVNLDKLTDEYRRQVEEKSNAREFIAAVDDACNIAKSSVPIPSAAALEKQFYNLGGWPAVVQEELHYLRSYLTHTLAEILDRRLAEVVEQVRREIMARILAEPIGRVLPAEARSGSSPRHQLEAFRRLLDSATQPNLVSGVDYLLSFSFSYQSHFHHRVRETMDPLDPMAKREDGDDEPISAIAPKEADGRAAETVGRGLRMYYERVIFTVRKRLYQEIENDPMRAIFSMVEETRDRLARARNVDRQWSEMLYPRRADIWPEEFNRFAVASAHRQDWLISIESVTRIASKLRAALA